MDNGIPMSEIDRTPFGRYMQIVRERAKRRADREDREAAPGTRSGQKDGGDSNVVLLRRGYIDDVM